MGCTGTERRDSPACVLMCSRFTAVSLDGAVSSRRLRSLVSKTRVSSTRQCGQRGGGTSTGRPFSLAKGRT
eukprot:5571255-Pleurochrysis_carterae.AAC.2